MYDLQLAKLVTSKCEIFSIYINAISWDGNQYAYW